MRASLRTSGAIFARAASVRGASIATAGAAGAQSPPHDESIVDEEALKKRAEYRAWARGQPSTRIDPGFRVAQTARQAAACYRPSLRRLQATQAHATATHSQ